MIPYQLRKLAFGIYFTWTFEILHRKLQYLVTISRNDCPFSTSFFETLPLGLIIEPIAFSCYALRIVERVVRYPALIVLRITYELHVYLIITFSCSIDNEYPVARLLLHASIFLWWLHLLRCLFIQFSPKALRLLLQFIAMEDGTRKGPQQFQSQDESQKTFIDIAFRW